MPRTYQKAQMDVPAPAIGQIWKPARPADAKHIRIFEIGPRFACIEPVYFARGNWCIDRSGWSESRRLLKYFNGKRGRDDLIYIEDD